MTPNTSSTASPCRRDLHAPVRGSGLRWMLAVALALTAAACGGDDGGLNIDDDVQTCSTGSTWAVDPATGACERFDLCDPSAPSPEGLEGCTPPAGCGGLDEAGCIQADGCKPDYGWGGQSSGGGGADSDAWGGEEPGMPCVCDPGDDCGCADPAPPPPEEETWGYLGCSELAPQGCDGLPEQVCIDRADCAPVYMGTDCACAAPGPGEGDRVDPNWCGCPEPTTEYVGCEVSGPEGCYGLDDALCHDAPGCRWVDEGSGADPLPCDCAVGEDCGCAMPAPSPGYCEPDAPTGCASHGDAWTCASAPDCEWVSYGNGGAAPMPCACEVDDPSCGCDPDDFREPSDGYCQETTSPRPCETLTDPNTCQDVAGCQWYPDGGGGGVIDPCWDASLDEAGVCRGPGDEPVLTECCERTEPAPPPDEDLCGPDVWFDEGSGLCVAPDGQAVPDHCCDMSDPMPPEPWYDGHCGPAETWPQRCEEASDPWSCQSMSECEWLGVECDCAPDMPGCACPEDGLCAPRDEPPPPSCYDRGQEACSADPTCEWIDDASGMPAPPPDACWGAWVDETGTCRGPADGVLPEHCCTLEDPLPPGYCQPRETPMSSCEQLTDPMQCLVEPGCGWVADPCALMDAACPDCDIDCSIIPQCLPTPELCAALPATACELVDACALFDTGVCDGDGFVPCEPLLACGVDRCTLLADAATCADAGCAWQTIAAPCFCDPDDNNCGACPEWSYCAAP